MRLSKEEILVQTIRIDSWKNLSARHIEIGMGQKNGTAGSSAYLLNR
jgi:hypothetical protein